MRILIYLALCFVVGCVHSPDDKREPAGKKSAGTDNKEESAYELATLNEIFSTEIKNPGYQNKMDIRFLTNSDGNYLSATAKKAFQEAVLDSLDDGGAETQLAKLVVKNLKSSLINNFIKTMRVYKIFNTGVQIDFVLTPHKVNMVDYTNDMESNNLVQINQVGQLSKKLQSLEQDKETEEIYKNSFLIPTVEKEFQYVGGVVSVYLEILDTSLRLKIPNPMKNGVKGFVRYRKIYKTKSNLVNFSCDQYAVKEINKSQSAEKFYTVDLYKNFNIENLIPVNESIEIYPGRLMASYDGRIQLLPNDKHPDFNRYGKSLITSVFTLETKKKNALAIQLGLKKISYSISDKQMSAGDLEFDITDYAAGPLQSEQNRKNAAGLIIGDFVKKCQNQITREFEFSQLIEGIIL